MQLNPSLLSDIPTIKRRAQALAMIEAIICPNWEDRYYSFNSNWGLTEEMASMRNGEGDEWFLLFGSFGAGIKGLAHESPLAGDLELLQKTKHTLPKEFKPFLDEPAFSWERMSFCYWRSQNENLWNQITHPNKNLALLNDGSADFLELLHQPAQAYVDFAAWYYEVSLPLTSVEAIYRCDTLTDQLVKSINSELSLADLSADVTEIGYAASSMT